MGLGQPQRVERDNARLFRGGVNGGGLRGSSAAYRDMAERDRVRAGGAERAGFGVMRVFSWLGTRLGCGKTSEGIGVMASRAPMIRFVVLAAVMFVGLQWLFADWFASIEARIWLYEHLAEWKR